MARIRIHVYRHSFIVLLLLLFPQALASPPGNHVSSRTVWVLESLDS